MLLKWGERMYPGFQPKPDDVFTAVGYTTSDISDNTHFHLHGISDRVRMENENLWRQLGPLVPAMQSGKVKREFVEVLYAHPFRHIQYNRSANRRPIATLAMLLCRRIARWW